jgi:hypothetical protein
MKYILRFSLLLFFLQSFFFNLSAQLLGGGEVHGSFQTDGQLYQKDSVIGAESIAEKVAFNSFFEMRYINKNFEAGMRYELFMPPMQGYDVRWKGAGFANKYVRYNGEKLEVTAGNFYEQFGSGMILRSYQEWNLGFDNALNGVRVKYKLKGLTITGLVAKQRFYWDLGPGTIRGVDAQVSLNEVIDKLKDKKTRIGLGGSFVSRYQTDQDPLYVLPENVGAFAGRFEIYRAAFNMKFEASGKINDPNASNNMIYKNGNAALLELGYSKKGFGMTLQAARADNMDFRSNRASSGFDLPISYIPAMTAQHAYSLAAMYPYASQANGQMGLQANIFYKIKKGKTLGGKYGTNININYALSQSIYKQAINDSTYIGQNGTLGYETDLFKIGEDRYYSDFNIKVQRKLSKKWDVSLMFMNVFYNMLINEGHQEADVHANIGIADIWWKYKPFNSLHFEIQELVTQQDQGNWSSVMIEYNRKGLFAAVIALYNQGISGQSDPVLYPSVTTGYTQGANRFSLSYGKQREGILCVGGVCRAVPAANGFSITINSSF